MKGASAGSVKGSPLPGKPLNDSAGLNNSLSSESERTESQQLPSPAPQNPFDLIAGDLPVASDHTRTKQTSNGSFLPDSPLRATPIFVPASPASSSITTPAISPAILVSTPKVEHPANPPQQQAHGTTQQPTAGMQPRVLPFEPSQRASVTTTLPPPQPQSQYTSDGMAQNQHFSILDDDDGNTEPSSQPSSHDHSDRSTNKTAFARLLNSKRRKQSDQEHDDDEEALNDGALIYGYLQKLGRNGKWQLRYFETDGECLSYYKSSKRSKLLATLDLDKVRLEER